ncbi:MAG: DinB family protein [Acidobacteriaceae bacterium]
MPNQDHAIREELLAFLKGGHAHATLDDAVKEFPSSLYAKKPKGTPHNAWQQLEHIRITLHDLVEFCTNPNYSAVKWPEEYWPRNESPASSEEWDASVKGLHKNLRAFEKIIQDPNVNLYAKIPWGDGQTILREALLAIDHTSYHVGQLIMLRKQLGEWKG